MTFNSLFELADDIIRVILKKIFLHLLYNYIICLFYHSAAANFVKTAGIIYSLSFLRITCQQVGISYNTLKITLTDMGSWEKGMNRPSKIVGLIHHMPNR